MKELILFHYYIILNISQILLPKIIFKKTEKIYIFGIELNENLG